MSSSQARAEWRERRTEIVAKFCSENGLKIEWLNDNYQLRIDGVLDIYPTNGRYHIIKTGERGDWHLSKHDLSDIYTKAVIARIDNTKVPDVLEPNFDFGDEITIQPYRQEYPADWGYSQRKWWQFWRKR
jgi:hypothetical protein